MFRTPQSDSESDDEQSPTIHPTNINQKFGYNDRAFDRPPLKTPIRLKRATASSISSSSSSSTTSSVFDEGATRTGTPFTPPISETPDLSSMGRDRPRLSSHGKLSTSLFVQRCVETSNIPSTAPATTSTAKLPSQNSSDSDSDSDYQSLVEGVRRLSVQDDERVSTTKASRGLDESSGPHGRSQLKKRSRQSVQEGGEYSQSPIKNGVSDSKNNHQNTSWTDETPPAEPKVQLSQNLGGAKGPQRCSKRKSAEIPSLVVTQIENEGKEVDAYSSGATAQNPPHPVQHQQKASLSAPRASHKRTVSAPGPHKKQDTTVASAGTRNASPTHPNEVDATNSLAPTYYRSRRRSTGSVVPEHTVIPPIEFPNPNYDEGVPAGFPNASINFSEVSRQNYSSELLEKTLDPHPEKARKSQKLEHMHPIKKNANDLKNEILRIIRRQKAKPAAVSTSYHGYVYIFKSDRFPGYVKIGSTVNAPDIRIKQWGTNCKFKAIQITDTNDKSFMFCRIVEQIVHAELYNEQRILYCNECRMRHILKMVRKGAGGAKLGLRPTEHGEWFEVSETKALEVVNKWRDWMIHQEPYKKDATLCSGWVWKHDMGAKWMSGTEAEWEVWRQFGGLDEFRLWLYDLGKWLREVSPPFWKLVNSRGSAFVLVPTVYFGIVGVNRTSCLMVAFFLLACRVMYSKFC